MALARLSVAALAVWIGSCGLGVAAPVTAGVILIRQPSAADAAPAAGVTTLRVLARAGAPARVVEIGASSGDRAFDAAARSAVRRWRYVPALTGNFGRPEWILVRFISLYAPKAALVRAASR